MQQMINLWPPLADYGSGTSSRLLLYHNNISCLLLLNNRRCRSCWRVIGLLRILLLGIPLLRRGIRLLRWGITLLRRGIALCRWGISWLSRRIALLRIPLLLLIVVARIIGWWCWPIGKYASSNTISYS